MTIYESNWVRLFWSGVDGSNSDGCGSSGAGVDGSNSDSGLSARPSLRAGLIHKWEGEIPLSILKRYDPERVRYYSFPTDGMADVILRLRRVIWPPTPRMSSSSSSR